MVDHPWAVPQRWHRLTLSNGKACVNERWKWSSSSALPGACGTSMVCTFGLGHQLQDLAIGTDEVMARHAAFFATKPVDRRLGLVDEEGLHPPLCHELGGPPSELDGDPDRVRQHWESSSDGGTTWTTAFDGVYVRQDEPGG